MSVDRKSFGSPSKKAKMESLSGIIVSKSPLRLAANGNKRFYLYAKMKTVDDYPVIAMIFGHEGQYDSLSPGDKFSVTVPVDWITNQKDESHGVVTLKIFPNQVLTKAASGFGASQESGEMPVPMTTVAGLSSSRNMDYVNTTLPVVEKLPKDKTTIGGKSLERQSFKMADETGSILLHFLEHDVQLAESKLVEGQAYLFHLLRFYKFENRQQPGQLDIFLSFTFESAFVDVAEKFEHLKQDPVSGGSEHLIVYEKATLIGIRGVDIWFRCSECVDGRMIISSANANLIKCACGYTTSKSNKSCGVIGKADLQFSVPGIGNKFVTAFNKGIFSLLKPDPKSGETKYESGAEFIAAHAADNLLHGLLESLIGDTHAIRIQKDKNILECVI